jgi:hypothetical protein
VKKRPKRRHRAQRRKTYKARSKRYQNAVRVAERHYDRAKLAYRRAGCALFEARQRARRYTKR